jgi:hypothetical protein
MSFTIQNLKNGSYIEIGMSDTRSIYSQIESGYIWRGINIKEKILEHFIIDDNWDILEQWKKSGLLEKKK